MLNVSQEYLNAVDNYIRNIVTRVYFNGSSTPLVDEIMNVSVSEIGQSQDSITMGDFCTNSAKVKFVMPEEVISLENGYFKLEHGILVGNEYVYVPMGTYYISEVESVEGSNQYTVKGFDRSTRMNKDYNPTVTLPTTLKSVVEDICRQCNVVIGQFTFPSITIDKIYEGSCKDTLKYMAGLMGKNAKINRNDELTFYWYNDPVHTISRDIQFMRGFTKTTEEDIVIHSLTSGTQENTLVSGVGRGITFENPYMKQSILDSILENVDGFTYTPSECVYRGNPALEIGDTVSVEDKDGSLKSCIISEHELILTAMKCTIKSKGSTEAETVMKQESPTEKKLKKMYNVMQNAFKESTDKIIGAKGGHYVIDYDENGYPTGWRIMDTPSLTDNTKMWIFNKNGLGFSADGGKTIKNFAFDLEGYLNANVIHTGALVGEYFELNLETGTLIMGERGSNGEFINKWLEVNENGLVFGSSTTVSETVKNVETLYALGDSTTTAPTSGWVYPAPSWQDGKYMWQKTIVTRSNGEQEEKVTCISGATGQNAINMVIESSNGFTIGEKITSTVLTARIYEGSTEKDSEGNMIYKWFISTDGGDTYSQLGTGKNITVSSSQILDNTKIYFEAE